MADNHRLLELAKDGDRDARDKLVTDNMGLVVSVARRYVGRGQELEDLIQIGLIGLVKAIDRFDMDYEVKLSTYAVPLIQGEIRRFLRDDGMVKVSRNLKTIYYRADRYRHEVEKNRGTEPGMEEICDRIVDRLCVSQLLDTLTPDERKLVVLRYFQDKTQGQTGQILGMSQVQVSRLEKKILGRLRWKILE